MKNLTLTLFALALAAHVSSRAELFIGPSNSTNRFVLASNDVAIISTVYPQSQYNQDGFTKTNVVPIEASLVSGGLTNPVFVSECKQFTTALRGPLELLFRSPVVISYRVISNTAIQSPIIRQDTTNSISIPAGKSVKFFAIGLWGNDYMIANAQIIRDTATFQGVDIFGGAEFDGPLTIRFVNPVIPFDPDTAYAIPYYLTDQALVLPDGSALQSPTGNFEIQMQKSLDLTNWFPSIVLPTSRDAKAFYRLRVAK